MASASKEIKVVLVLNDIEADAIRKVLGGMTDSQGEKFGCSQEENDSLADVYSALAQELRIA